MRASGVVLAVASACSYPPLSGSRDLDATSMGDAATPDAAQLCFGSFTEVCFDSAAHLPTTTSPVPADPMVLINTDDVSMCDQNNDKKSLYCVVAGASFTLAANQTLRAYGTKPLVLLSTSTFDLLGTVDVSSNHVAVGAQGVSAGANPTGLCTGSSAALTSGGGAGGSFGGKGGNGEQVGGGSGGAAAPANTTAPTTPRGGCAGNDGSPVGAGTGGNGGGAVDVIATMIQFTGQINASGAGGKAGTLMLTGGGGGGSGGMIVLDATTVTGNGVHVVNGGGGGQGGPNGDPGSESAFPTTAAVGGNNQSSQGGNGGAGGYTVKPNGVNGANASGNGGGGGGGGGIGGIHAPGTP